MHGFSHDAFVQMAFQLPSRVLGLYGRTECTYEPAMTKAFLHGRTEAIRTVQPTSVKFTKTYFSEAAAKDKIKTDPKATVCALLSDPPRDEVGASTKSAQVELPAIFTDPGWTLLNTSILSTSNCGNPALRLFGFGPVAADGFGIGYIIKDEGISVCATSKHVQTRRYLDTLSSYLKDVQQMILWVHRRASERSEAFVDHSGVLRDFMTGKDDRAFDGPDSGADAWG